MALKRVLSCPVHQVHLGNILLSSTIRLVVEIWLGRCFGCHVGEAGFMFVLVLTEE
jgi:hypothetical protein